MAHAASFAAYTADDSLIDALTKEFRRMAEEAKERLWEIEQQRRLLN